MPFHIHRVLATITDADQRFTVIGEPPVLARTGERRWTEDEAKRRVGWQVTRPETVQEKVNAVHDLVTDDEVATRVATDLLRRPKVAFKVSTETSVQDRVGAVHELVRDDEVATRIATDLLRRPEVAARAMTDTFPDYDPSLTLSISRARLARIAAEADVLGRLAWAGSPVESQRVRSCCPVRPARWRV